MAMGLRIHRTTVPPKPMPIRKIRTEIKLEMLVILTLVHRLRLLPEPIPVYHVALVWVRTQKRAAFLAGAPVPQAPAPPVLRVSTTSIPADFIVMNIKTAPES